MMARWYESLFPALEELGVGYVAFSPLTKGVLSGVFGRNGSISKRRTPISTPYSFSPYPLS